MELTLQLEQIWVFLQREGQGSWGVSCSINTCWMELLEREQGRGSEPRFPRLIWNGFSHFWSPHTLFSYLQGTPSPPEVLVFSLFQSLVSHSSWLLGSKPSWWQRRGISMDVFARPVDSLSPTHWKPEGELGWLVTGLIHGNSQCLGFCCDFVKEPDDLALGLDVYMGEKPRMKAGCPLIPGGFAPNS